jgi:hypothetical protein
MFISIPEQVLSMQKRVPEQQRSQQGFFNSPLGLAVVDAFTNASALGTGEMWLGYVLENRLT